MVGGMVAAVTDASDTPSEHSSSGSDGDFGALITLGYPGPAFRPIPRFTIDVPSSWAVTEFPGAIFIMGPAEDTEDWSNVMLTHQRVLRDTALEKVARDSWDNLVAENPDVDLKDERLVRFQAVHYVRELEFPPLGDAPPVSRLDSFVFGPVGDHATVDLFHFTWLNPAPLGRHFKPLYVKILSSFRFIDIDPDDESE